MRYTIAIFRMAIADQGAAPRSMTSPSMRKEAPEMNGVDDDKQNLRSRFAGWRALRCRSGGNGLDQGKLLFRELTGIKTIG